MNENEQNMLGNIFLSHRAISTIVSHAAQMSYGIVGLSPKNLAAGLAAAITKDSICILQSNMARASLLLPTVSPTA